MMVHTYFKEDDKYKVKMFLNMKAMFVDPIKAMEDIIEEYEKENNCSLGSDRETKILNLPESYLEEKEIRVFEQELDKEDVEEIKKHQEIIECELLPPLTGKPVEVGASLFYPVCNNRSC